MATNLANPCYLANPCKLANPFNLAFFVNSRNNCKLALKILMSFNKSAPRMKKSRKVFHFRVRAASKIFSQFFREWHFVGEQKNGIFFIISFEELKFIIKKVYLFISQPALMIFYLFVELKVHLSYEKQILSNNLWYLSHELISWKQIVREG